MANARIYLLLGLILTLPACAFSYKHHAIHNTIQGDRAEVDVEVSRDIYQMGLVLDLLWFRLGVPVEFLKSTFTLEDSLGGKTGWDQQQEQGAFRLEVPVVSFWNHKGGLGITYPGSMRRRQSFELWLGGDSDFRTEITWWAEAGLTYYHYNYGAVYLFAGYGEVPFSGSTKGVGPEFPITWNDRAGGWGGGLSITIFAGEYALEFIEYILDTDRKTREKFD